MACLSGVGVVFVLAGLCAASAGAVPYEPITLTTSRNVRNLRFLQPGPPCVVASQHSILPASARRSVSARVPRRARPKKEVVAA
jgi:hypothetical protein